MALASASASSHCSCILSSRASWGSPSFADSQFHQSVPRTSVLRSGFHRSGVSAQIEKRKLGVLFAGQLASSFIRKDVSLLRHSKNTHMPFQEMAAESNRGISASASPQSSSMGQEAQSREQLALTVSNVRLSLAPVEDLIPVERRLPAPKEVGVYALVPAALGQQVASDGNPFGLQRMSQEDAMGFTLGAATGKRAGPIDGPGWTLLDPAASLGGKSLSSTGPLLSSSPRRTLRVEFTCNKCWERTTRAINPQAYKTGTVFVQCQGCNVYHKLVDNLKLFHELKGPIYSPPGQLFHTPYDPFKPSKPGGFDGLPFL